jgi:hypothetical protein
MRPPESVTAAPRVGDRRSSSAFPSPIESEAFPVPCDNRLGADDHQGTAPSGPDLRNPDPKEPIGGPKLRAPWRCPTQDCELVTQRKVLGVE